MSHKLDNPIWDRGYNAYYDGIPRAANPHDPDSWEFQDWEDGWDAADSDCDDD